ncbi:hydroxyacid dehydrogenase [Ramlibacter sp. GTP1]|uniref:Hydroxyacid dehydrogenase n=2 Tax=Ramlibacter albus TaxID=2079448 RepID=A0A923S399_9BURK|nr:hydroxyacid dehydrogenase [Ramlibacter albus]
MDEGGLARLREAHEVTYDPKLVDDPARVLALAPQAKALVVRNRTQVRGELLGALGNCKAVGRLGVGLDNIDVEGCGARGIEVIPATGANARSVAEYVIAAAMLLLRGAYSSTAAVASGQWPRDPLSNGREISGKVLGLVGYGAIGRLTGELADALGMTLLAHDPAIAGSVPLDNLLANSDVVSVHVPLTESTRNLFDASRIGRMKRGAVLINTSRGGIVDEVALATALRSGALGGAALDVFAQEPLRAAPHFDGVPNLLLTPHVAGLTSESIVRVGDVVATGVLRVLARHG